MAYSLHIKRKGCIHLEDWINAVENTHGVKIDDSSSEITNPRTGEIISIAGNKGDVSILFQTKGFIGFGKSLNGLNLYDFQMEKDLLMQEGILKTQRIKYILQFRN